MEASLLEKSRDMVRRLQGAPGTRVDFNHLARALSDILDCSVYVVGRRGYIIGTAFKAEHGGVPDVQEAAAWAERFPETFNREFLGLRETQANLVLRRRCIFDMPDLGCSCEGKVFTLVPVAGGGRRVGTLVLFRAAREFSPAELLLAEYAAAVIASEVMRMRSERVEEEARRKASVSVAVGALSHSEREAIGLVLSQLPGREGLLVASKVADRLGITRSVIASALRKFESAGLIEARSLGMKGTYIKILDDSLLEQLAAH